MKYANRFLSIYGRRSAGRLFLFAIGMLFCVVCHAQIDIDSEKVYLRQDYSGDSGDLISVVSEQTGITISYSNKVYANRHVNVHHGSHTMRSLLDVIFSRFPVEYVTKSRKVIVAPVRARYFTVSGYCRDALTGEALIGANVYDTLMIGGSASNGYGFFSVNLPEGHCTMRASFVGYQTVEKTVELVADTMLSFLLHPTISMEEIRIKASPVELDRARMGFLNIPMEQMRSMPSLLGESDIIKAFEYTPGIQTGGEGFGGMSVRGGATDQNVVMLDDVPLYSPSHLGGIYSVFNSESVNSATLTKGGFPARYGGRLSSVLDVKMREGNMQSFSGYANIGLLASNATLEGPIVQDKVSFIISARRTYFDIISSQLQRSKDQRYAFNFYDIHAKLNWRLSDRDRLYASAFVGYDNLSYGYNYRDINIVYGSETKRLSINDGQKIRWGNIITSLRWNHVFGASLFSNTTLSFSRYRFSNVLTNYADENNETKFNNSYFNGINDYGVRTDFTWYTPFMPSVVRFGTNMVYHAIYPGVSIFGYRENEMLNEHSNGISNRVDLSNSLYRYEIHSYVEDVVRVGDFMFNAGLHLSTLYRLNFKPVLKFEPRVMASYTLGQFGVSLSYSRMTQFVQQVRLSTVASPADMWMPVSTDLPVPVVDHISGEVSFHAPFDTWMTIEGYFKNFSHQQICKNSYVTENVMRGRWDDLFSSGSGRAYGAEFFMHRRSGRLSGWLGYGYQKAMNRYDDSNVEFPADNDRTHSAMAFFSFKISTKVDVDASWQYATGAPVTISASRFSLIGMPDQTIYPIEGTRNAYRMPSTHSLNLGVNILRSSASSERKISFGVYNVYAHKNPMFVYWKANDAEPGHKPSYSLKQFNLIAWPWPYLKYSIKF